MNGLRVRGPYLNIRGWKSLQDQWSDWYGGRGWSAQRAMFEQLAWADRTIYQHSPVEAQCIFCWGHSSADWEQFDVAEATEFHSLLEAYAQRQPTSSAQSSVVAPIGVAPVSVAPIGQPIAPMTPVGFAPVGVVPIAPVGQPTVPITPVGFAPVGVAPVVSNPPTVEVLSATEQAVSQQPELLTITLTSDEASIISSGLRLMNKVTLDSHILAAFNTLAAALERSSLG